MDEAVTKKRVDVNRLLGLAEGEPAFLPGLDEDTKPGKETYVEPVVECKCSSFTFVDDYIKAEGKAGRIGAARRICLFEGNCAGQSGTAPSLR